VGAVATWGIIYSSLLSKLHHPKFSLLAQSTKMPYPETAEGFVIKDYKNWSDFTKEEVGAAAIN